MSLKILHVASEVAPLSKTGGLGDVAAALPEALRRAGHDARIVVPMYGKLAGQKLPVRPLEGMLGAKLRAGDKEIVYSVGCAELPGAGTPVYLVACPGLYERGSIYTSDPDEHLRFILLQRAALEIAQRLGWSPDIVHCHDWQTGLLPLYLRTLYAWDQLFAATRSVLTIHNLGYQGNFPASILADTGLDVCSHTLHQDDLDAGRIGFLKTGILWSGLLTTVSPTYARQVQTRELGVGLDDLLRSRAESFVGILNGIDTSIWNPRTDQHLPFRYSAKSLWRKEKVKEALLQDTGLPYTRRVPVIGMISRLTWQKGLDLLADSLATVVGGQDVRLVVLGNGERRYEEFFTRLQELAPDQVAYRQGMDERLAHLIEGGADIFLMPSLYEPCGLNQMYSLAYGTVPVVHRTGGLADSVIPFDPDSGEGNGIVFDHPTRDAVRWALETALRLHAQPAVWKRIVSNAMAADFSWDRQVQQYLAVYRRLLGAS